MIEVIRIPEVMRITGKSRSAIYSDIATGTFPRQLRIGVRSVGWARDEVQRHLERLLEERDNSRKDMAVEVPGASHFQLQPRGHGILRNSRSQAEPIRSHP